MKKRERWTEATERSGEERKRQREKETERERDSERERQRDRERDTVRQRESKRARERERDYKGVERGRKQDKGGEVHGNESKVLCNSQGKKDGISTQHDTGRCF